MGDDNSIEPHAIRLVFNTVPTEYSGSIRNQCGWQSNLRHQCRYLQTLTHSSFIFHFTVHNTFRISLYNLAKNSSFLFRESKETQVAKRQYAVS